MQLEGQGWVGTAAEDGSMIYRSPEAHAAMPGQQAAAKGSGSAAVAAQGFQIMSGDEVARHSVAMKSLQGAARDEYRNSHYEQLRRRAQEHGYWMPPRPPWAATAP
jgi:hypothetical protein